jgi:hypothetical protein
MPLWMPVLSEQVNLVPERDERLRQLGVVDVRTGALEQIAVEDQEAQGEKATSVPGGPRSGSAADGRLLL